eukprot:8381923-Prorocentrum_lima.AAC.1
MEKVSAQLTMGPSLRGQVRPMKHALEEPVQSPSTETPEQARGHTQSKQSDATERGRTRTCGVGFTEGPFNAGRLVMAHACPSIA